LEDPEFAKSMVRVGTPAEAKKVAAKLQEIGISPTQYVPRVARATALEASNAMQPEQPVPTAAARQPVVPGTAAQMLRKLPPAPPTTGMPNLRMGPPPAAKGPAAPSMMYPQLFPNDPISQMLQQRQQQVGGQ